MKRRDYIPIDEVDDELEGLGRRDTVLHPPRIKWLVEPTFNDFGEQMTAGLDEKGREIGSPVPVRPPIGLNVNQGGDELHGVIKKLMAVERAKFMAAVEAEQFETEDEANDFLCEDDLFPPGSEPWEDVFDFPESPPKGDATNGSLLASGAVKGGSRGPEEPTPPVASTSDQRASEGSGVVLSTGSSAEKPRPVSDDIGTERGVLSGDSLETAPSRTSGKSRIRS